MIPADKLLPQDMVDLWDKGPPEPEKPPSVTLDASSPDYEDEKAKFEKAVTAYRAARKDFDEWHQRYGDGPACMRMHASDAGHALAVEPERYSLDGPEPVVEAEPVVEPVTEPVVEPPPPEFQVRPGMRGWDERELGETPQPVEPPPQPPPEPPRPPYMRKPR